NALVRYDKAVPITMNQNGAVDEITGGDLVSITAMLRDFSVSDELIEDASDLSSSSWCGVKVFEDSLQIRPAIRGLFYIYDQILLTDVRLTSSAGSSPRVLHPHGSSLLTSIIEEHRFISVAEMAELADALDSGSSGRKPVEVRVLFSALTLRRTTLTLRNPCCLLVARGFGNTGEFELFHSLRFDRASVRAGALVIGTDRLYEEMFFCECHHLQNGFSFAVAG